MKDTRQPPLQRINESIRCPSILVIDEDGSKLGEMHPLKAMEIAFRRDLDLVEIQASANPPVCKIMNYGKWKYEQQKSAAEARKRQRAASNEVKVIQLRPVIDDNDFTRKINDARRFLADGARVKVTMRFKGRENAHRDIGIEKMREMIANLAACSKLEMEPKVEGRQAMMVLIPSK